MGAFAPGAAKDMDMTAAARAFKKAANKDFQPLKNSAADRAYPIPVSAKAVRASPDVHEAIFAAVHRRKGRRADQLPAVQLGGADRAGLGVAGRAFAFGLKALALAEPLSASPGRDAIAEKQGIAKPEQDDPYNYKNQNIDKLSHSLASWRPLL